MARNACNRFNRDKDARTVTSIIIPTSKQHSGLWILGLPVSSTLELPDVHKQANRTRLFSQWERYPLG